MIENILVIFKQAFNLYTWKWNSLNSLHFDIMDCVS